MRPFVPFFLRDLSLVLASVGLFAWEASLEPGSLAPQAVAIVAGLSAGLVGFLLHEWGHLLGALRAGAAVVAPERLHSIFLFRFRISNDRRQFLSMSWGGYLGSLVGSLLIVGLADLGRLSHQVAVAAVMLGALATLVLEVPIHLRIARGGPLPQEGIVYTDEG